MAPQDIQTTDIHAQATNKPMELRPKTNPNSNTNSDSMDTSEPSNPESSETSSDDSDSDSTSDNDEEIATLKPGQKPDFTARVAAGAPSLEDRLKAFLPQLKEANSKLANGGAEGKSMEDVGEDEPHIEMSLGLGLLEEKKGGDSDDEDEEEGSEGEEGEESEENGEQKNSKEKDVMGRLMGGRENQGKGIEEVG